MKKYVHIFKRSFALFIVIAAFIALNCTDSCYKEEDNYADAGDVKGTTGDSGDDSPTNCLVGTVFYPVDMTHPDKPCLVCAYLEDNVSTGWMPLADGAWCDDGNYCTGEGICDSGRCKLSGNPCPADRPYCTEQYGGVCLSSPIDDDDDDNNDNDDDDDDNDDNDDSQCWECATTLECMTLFGETWGCLDGCCEDTQSAYDDDDNDDTDS